MQHYRSWLATRTLSALLSALFTISIVVLMGIYIVGRWVDLNALNMPEPFGVIWSLFLKDPGTYSAVSTAGFSLFFGRIQVMARTPHNEDRKRMEPLQEKYGRWGGIVLYSALSVPYKLWAAGLLSTWVGFVLAKLLLGALRLCSRSGGTDGGLRLAAAAAGCCALLHPSAAPLRSGERVGEGAQEGGAAGNRGRGPEALRVFRSAQAHPSVVLPLGGSRGGGMFSHHLRSLRVPAPVWLRLGAVPGKLEDVVHHDRVVLIGWFGCYLSSLVVWRNTIGSRRAAVDEQKANWWYRAHKLALTAMVGSTWGPSSQLVGLGIVWLLGSGHENLDQGNYVFWGHLAGELISVTFVVIGMAKQMSHHPKAVDGKQ